MNLLNYVSLNDELLFSKESLNNEELGTRLIVDYIVNNNKVYECMGSKLIDKAFQINLKEAEGESPYYDNTDKYNYNRVEYRVYQDEPSKRKIIKLYDNFNNTTEILPLLLISNLTISNNQYKRCASEIDEDRGVFVVYYLEEDCGCTI